MNGANGYISTGHDTLDKMICGGTCAAKGAKGGIPKGSVVLIRGEPGTGKTTLAMHILSKFLSDQAKGGPTQRALFLSYEETPKKLMGENGRLRKYRLFENLMFVGGQQRQFKIEGLMDTVFEVDYLKDTKNEKPLMSISRDNFAKCLIDTQFKKEEEKGNLWAERLENGLQKFKKTKLGQTGEIVDSIISDVKSGRFSRALTRFGFVVASGATFLKKKRNKKKWEKEEMATHNDFETELSQYDLIVVDSLNGYTSLIKEKYPEIEPKNLLDSLCGVLKEVFGKVGKDGKDGTTIIFTGEYHYHPSELGRTISESFYCDLQIALKQEPVCVLKNYDPVGQSPLGYNLNTFVGEDERSIEYRSFCRVIKSRSSSNQARRCAYDIVSGKGIEFYDTYPGDGKIVLFAENAKQQYAWDSFFAHDVPESYPALRHRVFGQLNMETVFEGQRRLRNIPPRTDMYLGSFDCHWVLWYRDFKLKCDIDRLLRDAGVRKAFGREISKYSRLVNEIMKILKEDHGMILEGLLGVSPVGLIRLGSLFGYNKAIIDEVYTQFFEGASEEKQKKLIRAIIRTIESNDEEEERRKRQKKPVQEGDDPDRVWSSLSKHFKDKCHLRGNQGILEQYKDDNGKAIEQYIYMEDSAKFASAAIEKFKNVTPQPYKFLKKDKEKIALLKSFTLLAKPPSAFTQKFSSFLKPVLCRHLKLFGERRSMIIPELLKHRKYLCEPVDYAGIKDIREEYASIKTRPEDKEHEIWDKSSLLSVPYNADIGFFIYRKDILDHIKGELDVDQVKKELSALLKKEADLILPCLEDTEHCPISILDKKDNKPALTLKDFYEEISAHDVDEKHDVTSQTYTKGKLSRQEILCKCIARMIDFAAKRIVHGKRPETWEEMIVLTKLLRKNVLLETSVFASLVCTFLEILWSCGTEDLEVKPDYEFGGVANDHELMVSLLRAFHIYGTFFNLKIVERDSTLTVRTHDGSLTTRIDYEQPDQWVFARHWNSTLMDNLTAKDSAGNYVWCDKHAMDLEIMPIPASLTLWIVKTIQRSDELTDEDKKQLDNFFDCEELDLCEDLHKCPKMDDCFFHTKEKDPEHNGFEWPTHHSCWGEWGFGLLAGSENDLLAYDVINNLMSTKKVIERAFDGACLPTVEDFYKMYGQSKCFDVPERGEIEMPVLTYEKLREKYFKDARSRLSIYDYGHFSKLLHARLEIIRKNHGTSDIARDVRKSEDDGLITMCKDFIQDVHHLAELPILLEDIAEEPARGVAAQAD